jgi:hypothetical protein
MDHDRVNIHTTAMSCGVMELSRINEDTEGVLYALGSRLYHPSRGDPVAFFIFSDICHRDEMSSASWHLADAVKRLNLGTIDVSTTAENPKTGNFIVVAVWAINHEAFKKFYADARVKKLAKVGR